MIQGVSLRKGIGFLVLAGAMLATLTACPGIIANYVASNQSIQAAISSATPGTVLTIYGTHKEDVTLDVNDVTLKPGPGGATIDGGLTITGDNDTIENMTITGQLTTSGSGFKNLTFDPVILYGASVTGTYTCKTIVQPGGDIQSAINSASSGDGICVAYDNYGSTLTISKSIGLAGLGLPFVSKISINNTSNVLVYGFSFDAASSQISVEPNSSIASGLVIENNVFSGFVSVGIPTSNAGNILIKGNTFKNAGSSSEPIQVKATLTGGCSGTQVLDNTFESATNNGGADVNFSCTTSNSSDVTVSGNHTSGNSNSSSFVAFAGVSGNISVTNNSGTTSGSAIWFWGSVSGSAVIENNQFTNGGSKGLAILGGDYGNGGANTGSFQITGNTFASNDKGIEIYPDFGTGTVTAHKNNIDGNATAGLDNESSINVNATNNWWGCSAGPGHSGCDSVSGTVDYTPWAVSAF